MGEVRKGRQTPTQSVVLPYSSTYGAEAIDIYKPNSGIQSQGVMERMKLLQ